MGDNLILINKFHNRQKLKKKVEKKLNKVKIKCVNKVLNLLFLRLRGKSYN